MELNKGHRIIGLTKTGIFGLGLLFAFLFPILFLVNTSEFNEYPKLVLLVITSGLMLLLWSVRALLEGRFTIAKTPFDLAFIVLAIVFIGSTILSANQTLSLYGAFNNWHFTVVELLAFIGLFYALVTNVEGWSRIRVLIVSFLTSSFLVILFTLASYFGVFGFAEGTGLEVVSIRGFSPAGNVISLVSLALVVMVVGLVMLKNYVKVDKMYFWSFVVVSFIAILTLGLWLAPYMPGFGGSGTAVLQLDFQNSWQVAVESIKENALFGSGPSTYALAFLAYRPVALNLSENWNVIFNQAGNEYLTWMTTMGVSGLVGIALLYFATLMAIKRTISVKKLFSIPQSDGIVDGAESFAKSSRNGLILGVLLILVVYLFASSTVMSTGVLFISLCFWMLIEKEISKNDMGNSIVEEVVMSLATIKARLWGGGTSGSGDTKEVMQWVIAVPMVVVVLLTGYYAINDFRSNLVYAESIRALNLNQPARDVYESQQKAIQLNPVRDTYHRAYANTNISLARVLAAQAGETITDSQRSDVLSLIQQSIREVRIITELLNPISAVNWQVRGSVYQNLLGVAAGADQWALQAYQNAIVRAPSDPRLRLNVGSLFFTLAVNSPSEGTQGDLPGEEVPAVPTTKQANLARAEAEFLAAIQLKGDYANAYYNLAAVYIQAERLDLAKSALENTLRLVDAESPDYERAQADLDAINTLIEQQTGDTTKEKQSENANNSEESIVTPAPTPLTESIGEDSGSQSENTQ